LPATAALAPVAAGNTRLSAEFDYTLQPDGSRLSRYVPAVLRPYLSGQSRYRVEIVLGSQSEGLIVSSDLRGIDVDLPPPIGKPADQLVPLTVQIGSGAPDVEAAAGTAPEPQPLPLTVRYGERLAAGIELLAADGGALQARRVLVDVGSGRIPTPTQPGVHVTGRVDELELGDWIATLGRSTVERAGDVVADTATGADALRLQSIELHADQLHYQGYSVGGVQIGYRPAVNGGWSATVAGDGAEGTLDWQSAPSRGLVARLSKLKVRSAMRRASEPGAVAAAGPVPPAEPLDPTRLPTLDIDVEDLRIGDVRAGHLRLASERIGAGQRLTQLSASGAASAICSTASAMRATSPRSAATLPANWSGRWPQPGWNWPRRRAISTWIWSAAASAPWNPAPDACSACSMCWRCRAGCCWTFATSSQKAWALTAPRAASRRRAATPAPTICRSSRRR